jgi:Bifunctional DNA primase/polymerase, N-terminal
MNPPNMLALALIYSRNGVPIFPCREGDRFGRSSKSPYTVCGFHDATTDEFQIRTWWKKWPRAAVGLTCNTNGIIVIDADRHGKADGVSAMYELYSAYDFDPDSVPNISTPRDGLHYYFKRPASLGETRASLALALDVRDNGYVIAAGSSMATGLRYQLHSGTLELLASAIGNRALPEMPPWLSAMVEKPKMDQVQRSQFVEYHENNTKDVRNRLAGLLRAVALASPGERNAKLHWAACRAGEMVQIGLISEAAAIEMFAQAGTYSGLPTRETIATIKSGLATGRGIVRRG